MMEYHKYTKEEKFAKYKAFTEYFGLDPVIGFDEVDNKFVKELEENIKKTGHMESEAWTEGWKRGISYTSGRFIYNFIRKTKPRRVLETGVAKGVSTSYILSGLRTNRVGFLVSVDINEKTGFLVNDILKDRWLLLRGQTRNVLPTVMVNNLDLFLHDSDHSYDNMMFEYKWAHTKLKIGGVLLSHDINKNNAMFDFSRKTEEELFFIPSSIGEYVVGAIIKSHDVDFNSQVDVDSWLKGENE